MADTPPQTGSATEPAFGITMGDPLGIGPEIIVKALADKAVRDLGRFFIFGTNDMLLEAAEKAKIEPFWWRLDQNSEAACPALKRSVVVIDHQEYHDLLSNPITGRIRQSSRGGGQASLSYLRAAMDAAMAPAGAAGAIDAIITAPISKTSWQMAGLKRFPGHTELLAKRAGVNRFAMMFVAPQLRVILTTIHLPLMAIQNVLTIGRVFDPIDLGHEACQEWFGLRHPRIAVCGLNPHASEGGLFGDEEARVIEPAIRQASLHGIDVRGPFPADTIFSRAIDGEFDLVVAMYHDQGLIPVKLLARDEAVNVTIGLPFVRTSPDHGTAFDIAGRNKANAGSMRAAIRLAADMVNRRRSSPDSAEK